jgi:ABC-2 type transport system ATP-binding protein
MAKQYILEVEGVSKSFGRKQVLDEVSLKAERGAITSIVGENGSGKTTLLRIIVGMLGSDSGKVRLLGRPGYCPQDLQVFDSLTLRENLVYFATAYGLRGSGSDWKRSLQSLVDDFQLRKYMDLVVGKLSGGTRQKLNLIIALLHDPDLLILDEPYAAFDWESYEYFWELVGKMKQQQKSFLIVSHMIYDRKNIDKVFELKDGRLV